MYVSHILAAFLYGRASCLADQIRKCDYYFCTTTILRPTGLCPGLPRWAGTRKVKTKNQSGFSGARDSGWRWHQLGHLQICTLSQTDKFTRIPPLSFITGRMPFLPPNQQRQSTHTHNHFTALWIFSGTPQVSRYQKKRSPTHTHRGHQISLSASSIYYDPSKHWR